jgi:hypothetical protein
MRTTSLLVVVAIVLGGCSADVPAGLAKTVLLAELAEEGGIVHDGFLACVAVEGRDADSKLLGVLRQAHLDVVPASECQWDPAGSFHRVSGRKAMLVNVHGYDRARTIKFEARHHMRYATMKTLVVARESSGWKIVRTLELTMASAERSDAGDTRNARA